MAMTKLPRGTKANVQSVVPTGGAPKSSTGSNIKPAGSQRISKGAKVTRAAEGQTNGVIPRRSAPGGKSAQGDNKNRKPTSTGFGNDKAKAGGRKVAGPISSGGGSFGQS